jgi:hypothetical protein
MGVLVDKMLRSLRAAHSKSQWHSMASALKDLTEEQAVWRPSKYKGFPWASGNIVEIVYHVALDKLVQLSCAFGDRSFDWEATKSLPEVQVWSLANAVQLLDRSQKELMAALEKLSDEDLDRKVATWGGKQMTAEHFFDMLIEHDFYHAGQIRYIRSMLDGGM